TTADAIIVHQSIAMIIPFVCMDIWMLVACEAGTRHGHYFWKPKKVLLKALLCDFLNHLINREL
ncbi:MAG: hypothetical protein SPL43_05550, partial [Prevotella sp.]|nr:hypothetical protein [Prevotella sp.]